MEWKAAMVKADRTVAVSGLGSIGSQHIRALATIAGVRVVAFDPDPALRKKAAAEQAVETTSASFDELIGIGPDAVVLAGPDHTHIPQLRLSVAAGIPALVEKPLAASAAEAGQYGSTLSDATSPILVGYVLRHRLVVQQLRDLIQRGTIGRPTSVQVMLGAYNTITAAASRFARPESDRLYRDYSHEWDYLRWIFGPVTRVLAVARTAEDVPHVEQPNLVDAMLELSSGVMAACHIDYVEPRGLRTMHVVGTGGSIFADIGAGALTVRAAGHQGEEHYRWAEPASGPLTRQAQHLLAVAAGEHQPLVSYSDGLAALQVAEALRDSAERQNWLPVADQHSDHR